MVCANGSSGRFILTALFSAHTAIYILLFVAVAVVRRNLFLFLLDDQFFVLLFSQQTKGPKWCQRVS